MTERINLLDLAPAESRRVLAGFVETRGLPSYRVDQIHRRLWALPAAGFSAMTELPAALRSSLAESFEIPRLTLASE